MYAQHSPGVEKQLNLSRNLMNITLNVSTEDMQSLASIGGLSTTFDLIRDNKRRFSSLQVKKGRNQASEAQIQTHKLLVNTHMKQCQKISLRNFRRHNMQTEQRSFALEKSSLSQ